MDAACFRDDYAIALSTGVNTHNNVCLCIHTRQNVRNIKMGLCSTCFNHVC